MAARPFQVIECEVTKPGSEARAIANPEVAALWAEGWWVAYMWIRVQRQDDNTTEESFLMIVMAPPRDSDDATERAAERAALGALISSISEGQTTAAEGQSESSRYARGAVFLLAGIAVVELAQVVLAWVAAAS